MITLNRQALLNRICQRGYSQKQLQALTGFSSKTLQNYINVDNKSIHFTKLTRLARVLNCPPLELIDGAIGTI